MKKLQLSITVSFILFFSFQLFAEPTPRQTLNFSKGWRFYLGDEKFASQPDFNDASWRKLNLPHDWSIEGEFNEKNPATVGGGALPGGIGWYRKTFLLPVTDKGKPIFIDFDGVYRNSEVWVNGHYLGKYPSGYFSFRYELTAYLHYGDQKNTISVRVDNSEQPNSRWYSGSGIYRNVWLTITQSLFIDHYGTYITTSKANKEKAVLKISNKIRSKLKNNQPAILKSYLLNATGTEVARINQPLIVLKDSTFEVSHDISVNNPVLWSVENPYLYKLISEVTVDGKITDRYQTMVGIRSINFDKDKGFFLNGQFVKIKGVCNHHDLGSLGSAINTRALERQLELLKAMGCNAIRTSHNPPAPELLDLCDKMGFLVMDESFDMWKEKKSTYDYAVYWDEWHKKDLENFIRRDRNHPCVIIWSIGNEIPEQWNEKGAAIARELGQIVRNLDTTRPITMASNDFNMYTPALKTGNLDILGFNYGHLKYDTLQKMYPGKTFILTETTSALETRGHYDTPSDSIRRWPTRWDLPLTQGNPDFTCSAYDNVSTPWGSTHEETWKIVKKKNYLSGMFIWTGFDYLGEPTPYSWPARSSYFGIIDLAGFPKDVYYMYQSEWTKKPVLHVFPHWNWKEGEIVDVWVYANSEEVELFLNDKSLGTKRKTGDEMHLMWKIPYTPGKLKAVSRTKNKEILTQEIKTAGKPAKISLSADRKTIKTNGDLSFITVKITDADGVVVPNADNLVKFEISGEGALIGVDNGNPVSHESFKADNRKALNGLCLAIVQSKETIGNMKIKATGEGLESSSIIIEIK